MSQKSDFTFLEFKVLQTLKVRSHWTHLCTLHAKSMCICDQPQAEITRFDRRDVADFGIFGSHVAAPLFLQIELGRQKSKKLIFSGDVGCGCDATTNQCCVDA